VATITQSRESALAEFFDDAIVRNSLANHLKVDYVRKKKNKEIAK